MVKASCSGGMTVPPPCLRRGRLFEHAAQALDMGGGPVGEVAEGAFADLPVLAVALAQEDGGGRVAVRDGVDIHGWNGVDSPPEVQSHSRELHGYVLGWPGVIFPGSPPDYSKSKKEARFSER
jgi:hypothetical protein